MNFVRAVLIPAALVATTAVAAVPLSPAQQRALDRRFVCPEKLLDDAARLQAITRFMDDFARFDRNATVNDRLAYRSALLAKHKCQVDDTHYSFPQT